MARNTLSMLVVIGPLALTACGQTTGTPTAAAAPPAAAAAAAARPGTAADENDAVGVVQAVNTETDTITISHEPIDKLGWPAMTMPFKVSNPALLQGIDAGEKVRFHLKGTDMSNVVVTSVLAANQTTN